MYMQLVCFYMIRAFDTVGLKLLIDKLFRLGTRRKSFDWIEAVFPTVRSLAKNGKYSELKTVSKRDSQWAYLSSTLLNLSQRFAY